MEFVYLGMVKRNTLSTCISLLIKKFLLDVDVKPSNAPWFEKRLALIFSHRSLIKELGSQTDNLKKLIFINFTFFISFSFDFIGDKWGLWGGNVSLENFEREKIVPKTLNRVV